MRDDLGDAGAKSALPGTLQAGTLLFHLPEEVALAVVLSVLREDGVLLNPSEGALLRSLSSGQLFTAVYLAKYSDALPGHARHRTAPARLGDSRPRPWRQVVTSLVSAWVSSQVAR